eukprot:3489627-Heterocapsa_arctica.AAC.1
MERSIIEGDNQAPPLSNEDTFGFMMITDPSLFDTLIQAQGAVTGNFPAQEDNPAWDGYHQKEDPGTQRAESAPQRSRSRDDT